MYNSVINATVITDHETGKNAFIPRKPVIGSVYPFRVKIIKFTRELSYVKVKCSRYRPSVAQRVGRGIALLFHDRGTRRG